MKEGDQVIYNGREMKVMYRYGDRVCLDRGDGVLLHNIAAADCKPATVQAPAKKRSLKGGAK